MKIEKTKLIDVIMENLSSNEVKETLMKYSEEQNNQTQLFMKNLSELIQNEYIRGWFAFLSCNLVDVQSFIEDFKSNPRDSWEFFLNTFTTDLIPRLVKKLKSFEPTMNQENEIINIGFKESE